MDSKALYHFERKYTVTKRFTGGLLAGLTYEEQTDVEWRVGDIVARPLFGTSPFEIVDVKRN